MCDYCGDMDRKHEPKPLREGALGSLICKYFEENNMGTPINAELLEYAGSLEEINYRITLDDDKVADYKVTFERTNSIAISSIEEFNRVI